MPTFENNTVESQVLGRSFRYPQIMDFLIDLYPANRYRDVLCIEFDNSEVWVFDYGVIVCWGISQEQKMIFIESLKGYIEDIAAIEICERYTFSLSHDSTRIHEDNIELNENDRQDRHAVSHALSQSVKLAAFEDRAQQVILKNEYIPRSLAKDGKIPLHRKDLAKLRGTLFSVKSDILLNFNLLDTPEYIWNYPELEPVYNQVSRYLDINARISVLSKKLETIHELHEMLASEQNHQHSSLLEWIIIILIAVEIVLFFWH